MEGPNKKQKIGEEMISTNGSPELLAYRKKNLIRNLPTVMGKHYCPVDINGGFPENYTRFDYRMDYAHAEGLKRIPRVVISELILKHMDHRDVFSLMYSCKQFFNLCHAELLKRSAKLFQPQFGTTKALSCLLFYRETVEMITANKKLIHNGVGYMEKTVLAYNRFHKHRLKVSLLLSPNELKNFSFNTNSTPDPAWPLILVLAAIKKNGCIDNLTTLKEYAVEQGKAKRLEQCFIQSMRPVRMQLVVDEFTKNGYLGVDQNQELEIFKKFVLLVNLKTINTFSTKLESFLKMQGHHDNPYYVVNSLIPRGDGYRNVFNALQDVSKVQVYHRILIRLIFESIGLFYNTNALFRGVFLPTTGEILNLPALVQNIINVIVSSIGDVASVANGGQFICYWDKKSLVLKRIEIGGGGGGDTKFLFSMVKETGGFRHDELSFYTEEEEDGGFGYWLGHVLLPE